VYLKLRNGKVGGGVVLYISYVKVAARVSCRFCSILNPGKSLLKLRVSPGYVILHFRQS